MGETSGPPGPVPAVVGGEDKPLRAASRRLNKNRRPSKLSDVGKGIAVGLSVLGVPANKIGSALDVPKSVIDHVRSGRYGEQLQSIRDQLQLTKMQKALLIEERLWNLADKKIADEDAKAVDGVLRAIHASEKIQQAVAGETQKIEHVGTSLQTVDLAGLVQILIQEQE